MILSIIGQSSHTENAMLAANVAAARVKSGNKVLLIETDMHMSLFLWNLRRKHGKVKFPVLALVCGGSSNMKNNIAEAIEEGKLT